MSRNAEYLSTMETQLKQWDADLDALAAEGDKAAAQMHARMQVAWETMHKALQKVSSDLRK